MLHSAMAAALCDHHFCLIGRIQSKIVILDHYHKSRFSVFGSFRCTDAKLKNFVCTHRFKNTFSSSAFYGAQFLQKFSGIFRAKDQLTNKQPLPESKSILESLFPIYVALPGRGGQTEVTSDQTIFECTHFLGALELHGLEKASRALLSGQ